MRIDISSRIAAVMLSFLFLSNDLMASTLTLYRGLPETQKTQAERHNVLFRPHSPAARTVQKANAAPETGNITNTALYADFKAEHTSGYLGGHKNDPMDKPYDDIFDVYFGEKAGDYNHAYLMYEVYGLSNGADLPKSINGSATFGQLSLQAEGRWSTVTVAVDPAYLQDGLNRIQFALPHDMETPVEVRNVKIRLSGEAMEGATIQAAMLRTLANREDFRVLGDMEEVMAIALTKAETPSIPTNLVNLTRNAQAYRFSGSKDQVYSIAIGVNGKEGTLHQLGEVSIFYFDRETKSWKTAHVDRVNFETGEVEAAVPGGTDYFAGLIKTPEMPEASAYLPTAISDIEPANPATGMRLMEPPTVSQTGEASLQYPLYVPQGRAGMTPSVALTYSSDAGTGWLGVGWNVGVQSISVDTRWGVPDFPTNIQEEVYLLNGEALFGEDGVRGNRPIIENNTLQPNPRQTGAVRFFERNANGYKEITRKGDTPDEYFWVVTTADQTRYYYGTQDGVNFDANSVLATGGGNIAKWFLTKVEDKWGNTMTYSYDKSTIPSSPAGMKAGGKTLVLSEIEYAGHQGSAGKYTVEFISSVNRIDATVSMNMGLKYVDHHRLDTIKVLFDGNEVLHYGLVYEEGDFSKTRLNKVEEYRSGEFFYAHEFDYYSGQLTYGNPETLEVGELSHQWIQDLPDWMQDALNPIYDHVKPSPLKTTQTLGYSFGGSVGVGASPEFIPLPDKSFTFNGNLGYASNSSEDQTFMQDFNGDGIPDVVFDNDDEKHYYPLTRNESGGLEIGNRRTIVASDLQTNESNTFTYGFDFTLPAELYYYGRNWNRSTSTVSRYMTDYNADGFPDLVQPSGDDFRVWFGHMSPVGHYSFLPTSIITPNPVITGETPVITEEPDPVKAFEIVRVWEAPKDGDIDIYGDAVFQEAAVGNVRIGVQHNDVLLDPFATISTTTAHGIFQSLSVVKGDKILFRVQPGADGQKDFLQWDPRVEYTSPSFTDGNGTLFSNSTYQDGFLLSAGEAVHFTDSDAVKVILNRVPVEIALSDDAHYRIILKRIQSNGNTTEKIYQEKLPAGEISFTGVFETKSSQAAGFIDVYEDDFGGSTGDEYKMSFQIFTHSNVDWKDVQWRPEVHIQSKCANMPVIAYPNVEYHTYNYTEWIAGEPLALSSYKTGIPYEVLPQLDTDPALIEAIFSGFTGDVEIDAYMTVKSGNHILAKKALRASSTNHTLEFLEIDGFGDPVGSPLAEQNYNGCGSCAFPGDSIIDGKLYVEFHTFGPFAREFADYINNNILDIEVRDEGDELIGADVVNYNVFARILNELQIHHKNWGQFAWSPDNVDDPILMEDLHLSTPTPEYDPETGPDTSFFSNNESALNPMEQDFFMLTPVRGEKKDGLRSYMETGIEQYGQSGVHTLDRWAVFGSYMAAYSVGGFSSPGYLGEEENKSFAPAPPPGSGVNYIAYGAPQVTKSFSLAKTSGNLVIKSSQSIVDASKYYSYSLSSFRDVNGDGYPDILNSDPSIQLTNAFGGHENPTVTGIQDLNKSHSSNFGPSISGSFANNDKRFEKSGFGFSASVNLGKSNTLHELLDINGDGLPDRVESIGGQEKAFLNTGSSFLPAFDIQGIIGLSTQSSLTLSLGLSHGLKLLNTGKSKLAKSFHAGLNLNSVGSEAERMFMDFNGDGLADQLTVSGTTLSLLLNTGTEFVPLGANLTGTTGVVNGSHSFGFAGQLGATFSFPLFLFVKMSISANGSGNFALNKVRSSFTDMNGDGVVDFVLAQEDGDLAVYYSQVGKSNKLKTVTNPVGGSFTIDYKLTGNRYGMYDPVVLTHTSRSQKEKMVWDMPDSKWVMSELTISDNLDATLGSVDMDGEDEIRYFFKYDGGIKSRRERKFLGFARTEKRHANQAGEEGPLPKDYLTEVTDYARPLSNLPEEMREFEYQSGQINHKYSLYNQEYEQDDSLGGVVVVHDITMISDEFYKYDHLTVSTTDGKLVWDDGTEDWETVQWATIGESEPVFPAVVSIEQVSFPVLTDRDHFQSRKFNIEYDAYLNVVRYMDNGNMQGGSLDSVIVDTMYHTYFDYIYQDNNCSEGLSSPFYNDGVFAGYAVACIADPSYQNDTIWVRIGVSCLDTAGPFAETFCANPLDTFVSVHRKKVTDTIPIYEPAYNVTYSGNLIAEMDYFAPAQAANRTNALKEHRIYLGSTVPQNLKRRAEVSGLEAGKAPAEIKNYLSPTEVAVTNLEYDTLGMGNVVSIEGPANHDGQRATVTFTYDTEVYRFVEGISNAYGESVCNRYDYATGLLLKSTDVNGHATRYQYDDYHRLAEIWAPRELYNQSSAATIEFEYYPWGIDSASTDPDKLVPVALTLHNTGNDINNVVFVPEFDNCANLEDLSLRPAITSAAATATFIDGMARPVQIQTENSHSVANPNGSSLIQWLNESILRVSGFTEYNKFGNAVSQRADFLDPAGSLGTFSRDTSAVIAVTHYDYAYREKNLQQMSPNPSDLWLDILLEYEWQMNPSDSAMYFTTTTTTDDSVVTRQFTDSRGQTVLSTLGDAETYFAYDDLGQLLGSTDPIGEVTTYQYDDFGRVTQEAHPDRGQTDMTYDLSGNVIEIVNPATDTSSIKMTYNFNRLITKTMPTPSGTNTNLYDITYSYGTKGDGKNGAGRVTQVTQGGDFKLESYKYNELGQLHSEYKQIAVPNIGTKEYQTGFVYDSFGRILEMTYPGGDRVRYHYTGHGELERMTSQLSELAPVDTVISRITYDGYGNIGYLRYGNGTETEYNYLPDIRQLSQATVYAKAPSGSVNVTMSDREYGYNTRGMVSTFKRTVHSSIVPNASDAVHEFAYTYDNMNRLSSTTLDFDLGTPATFDYELGMSYNEAGGITSKTSDILSVGTPVDGAMDYTLEYYYEETKPHQVDRIEDSGSGSQIYTYNTSGSVEKISQDDVENVQQAYYWNEEQWLMGAGNEQGVHHYVYDQNGERIMKSSVTLDWTEVNGENINETANLAPYTLYVNAYYVVTAFSDTDKVSKHYYMGMQRVASELVVGEIVEGFSAKTTGSQDSLTLNDTSVWQNLKSVLGHFGMEENTDYTMAELQRQPALGDYRSAAEIPLDASASSRDYPDAEGSSMNKMDETPGSRVMYWYHPDYLGNVELITDYNGEVYEFFFYNPWGESLYEWQSGTGTFTSPYRFNGKELDPETGLHYYGARYYNSRTSIWLSVDPLAVKGPNITPYAFSHNNPVMMVDPDGQWPEWLDNTFASIGEFFSNTWNVVTGNSGENTTEPATQSSDYTPSEGELLNTIVVTGKKWEGGEDGSFITGFSDGFGAGFDSTVDFFKSLGTSEGWESLGQGMIDMGTLQCQTCPQGMLMRAQMTDDITNYVQNIPNMSAYEMGYDLGFGAEKAVEMAVTRGVSTGVGAGIGNLRFLSNTTLRGTTLFKTGKNFRIDLDSRNGLHYHRRGPGGIGRHRPWQIKPGDRGDFWKRF